METHTGYTGAGTPSPSALSRFTRCVGASYLLEPRGLGSRLEMLSSATGSPSCDPDQVRRENGCPPQRSRSLGLCTASASARSRCCKARSRRRELVLCASLLIRWRRPPEQPMGNRVSLGALAAGCQVGCLVGGHRGLPRQAENQWEEPCTRAGGGVGRGGGIASCPDQWALVLAWATGVPQRCFSLDQ